MSNHEIELITRNDSREVERATGSPRADLILSLITAEDDEGNASSRFNLHSVQGAGGHDTVAAGIFAVASAGFVAEARYNVNLAWGDAGSDVVSGSIATVARDGRATAKGNSQVLNGGAGNDEIETGTSSFASGGTALTSHNATLARGGVGDDRISANLAATSSDGQATTRDNLISLQGGAGDDSILLTIVASATAGGRTSLVDNIVSMSGGAGADRIVVSFETYAYDAEVTVAGNRFVLNGGSGDDILSYYAGGLSGNTAVLIGGAGTDLAEIDMQTATADLTFDVSRSYDQVLPGGIRLLGIEALRITSGTGDDTFRGGSGDDLFDGGEGFNRVILDGEESDYEFGPAEDGWTRVTDLRPGAPGGSDLFLNVDEFVFGTAGFDLV